MSGRDQEDNAGSTAASSKGQAGVQFPIGLSGKRELRRALLRATDPAKTIETFQQSHSLHSMVARAFGTVPRHEEEAATVTARQTRRSDSSGQNPTNRAQEPLDTDPVLTFLSHLGVSQYEAHKRISDALLKELEATIRQTTATEPLLQLLQSSWVYATTIPDVRPVVWAVLKQLGNRTPPAVLQALGERDPKVDATEDKQLRLNQGVTVLKHKELFNPLPSSLKRLVWEQDLTQHVPAAMEYDSTVDASSFKDSLEKTLLYLTLQPYIDQYCQHTALSQQANRPFVGSAQERRMLTTQRRALTAAPAAAATTAPTAAPPTAASAASVLRSAAATAGAAPPAHRDSGKAVAQIRTALCDRVGTAVSFRPKLLYGLLSILMVRHGERRTQGRFLGAEGLSCTLVADILLAAGGPLPKSYNDILKLARLLDEAVQDGNLSDAVVIGIQTILRDIFQHEGGDVASSGAGENATQGKKAGVTGSPPPVGKMTKEMLEVMPTTGMQRQLNRIITTALVAMKENDTQNLFLNPVTDKIAPGYSKVIKQPMCIAMMEDKVEKNEYRGIADWETDVKLMYKNCIDYNQGAAGQWFRGEAMRQNKAFRDEIFPVARREYQNEVAKRTVMPEEIEARKRKAEEMTESSIRLLPPSNKKRKKDTTGEYQPSMPALASMLLADPFVTRLILARLLLEIRKGVVGGISLPVSHSLVPSLLQILHLVMWSSQICAIRGRKYFVPDLGSVAVDSESGSGDPISAIPFVSLRRSLPLLVRLLMEADLDRRVAIGGDLHAAAQVSPLFPQPVALDLWVRGETSHSEVDVSLFAGSLVHLCQPVSKNETSLAVTFPKFAAALRSLSPMLMNDRSFFLSLIFALLKHKSKLPRVTRDAVIDSWIDWLRRPRVRSIKGEDDKGVEVDGSMTSSAHECFILLLNEWSSLGNLLLPRDKLIQYSLDAVKAANASEPRKSRKFVAVFNIESAEVSAEETVPSITDQFTPVRKQYLRLLKNLPASNAEQWRIDAGIGKPVIDASVPGEDMSTEKD
jgi:Bromodomain